MSVFTSRSTREAANSILKHYSRGQKAADLIQNTIDDETARKMTEAELRKRFESLHAGAEFMALARTCDARGEVDKARHYHRQAATRFLDGFGAADTGLAQSRSLLMGEEAFRCAHDYTEADHCHARAMKILRESYEGRVKKTESKRYQRGLKRVLSVMAPVAGVAGVYAAIATGPLGWAVGAAVTVTGFAGTTAKNLGDSHLDDAVELILLSRMGMLLSPYQNWHLPQWVRRFEKAAEEKIAKMGEANDAQGGGCPPDKDGSDHCLT